MRYNPAPTWSVVALLAAIGTVIGFIVEAVLRSPHG